MAKPYDFETEIKIIRDDISRSNYRNQSNADFKIQRLYDEIVALKQEIKELKDFKENFYQYLFLNNQEKKGSELDGE